MWNDKGQHGGRTLRLFTHVKFEVCFRYSQVEMLSRQVDMRSQNSRGRLELEVNRRRAQSHGKGLA